MLEASVVTTREDMMHLLGIIEHYFGLFVLAVLLVLTAIGSVRGLLWYFMPPAQVPPDITRAVHDGSQRAWRRPK